MPSDNMKHIIMERREMMKAVPETDQENEQSDQQAGLPQPPLGNEIKGENIITLTKEFDHVILNNDFNHLLNTRTSKRKYSEKALTLEELAFLLWSTQGVKSVIGKVRKATMRTVPSAGARHPFETYLFINQVEGLEQGLYHYLSIEHKLEFLGAIENHIDRVTEAFAGQSFFANAPVGFVWTVVPYRTEWRYTTDAQKYALIDVGHICQNLYLSSEAIGCGTCAVGAYDQYLVDKLLGLDSKPSSDNEAEFAIYAASLGKVEE